MNSLKSGIFCLLLLFLGCTDDDKIIKTEKSDAIPGVLTNVVVENIPGGAKITYSLPNDNDLLYVEAAYASKLGEPRVTKASLYINSLQITGFADTLEYDVKLYAVNRSENRSTPINVKIKPLTPPVQTVFNSLQVKEDFGGINITFSNELENEFIISTMVGKDDGTFVIYDKLYSKAKSRSYSIRGLESKETEFRIFITDKWKNVSDTLKVKLTPIFEEMISKTDPKWVAMNYPNDTQVGHYPATTIEKIWDGSLANTGYFIGKLPAMTPLPNWFTINMGKPYKLSRMKMYQYTQSNYAYTLGNPEIFEIWGSNDPHPDGRWDNWTLILSGQSIKPSGSLGTGKTAEDNAYGAAGEDFAFPTGTQAYQYIRFKTVKTWGRADNVLLAELTFWGGK